jgi:hypothetical protein
MKKKASLAREACFFSAAGICLRTADCRLRIIRFAIAAETQNAGFRNLQYLQFVIAIRPAPPASRAPTISSSGRL